VKDSFGKKKYGKLARTKAEKKRCTIGRLKTKNKPCLIKIKTPDPEKKGEEGNRKETLKRDLPIKIVRGAAYSLGGERVFGGKR